jgi:uncharacterized membrane protein
MKDQAEGEVDQAKSHEIELVVSTILRYGVVLSFLVIAVGSILLLTSGQATVRLNGGVTPHNPTDVIAGVLQGNPKAIIDLGLLMLIATPVARVAAAVVAFFTEADYAYTLISLYVLLVLIASFFLGTTG